MPLLTDRELVASFPPNLGRTRRLALWTWRPESGTSAVVASAVGGIFQRWQDRYPKNVLHYDVYGSAFGLIQVRAFVEWQTQFKVSMHCRDLNEILKRKVQYPGGMPHMLPVRWRSGGNLRRADGPDSGQPGVPDAEPASS